MFMMPLFGGPAARDYSEMPLAKQCRDRDGSEMETNSELFRMLNQIQNTFALLGHDPIELPKIVVVGTQSSGKSSVLEALVRKSFLPRDAGLCTRCPLVIQLNHCPPNDYRRKGKGLLEWGEFLHGEGKIFRMEDICDEIKARTTELAGKDKGIVRNAITLKVFSPHVVNLTLVDLPGITKVPVGDQPRDIEHQVLSLIMEYIKNPLSLILAVVTANTDMTTNDSLKLAQLVDPNGARTLAVLTKLDLMDQGTDAREILTGKIIPVKLGIVGVVNRSQKDLLKNKSMEVVEADERKFFQCKYPDLASRQGTSYLARRLSDLFRDHINDSLPAVKDKIYEELREYMDSESMSDEDVVDRKELLMSIIIEFSLSYSRLCENGPKDVMKGATSLIGGAKISRVLHTNLKKTFDSLNPLDVYDRDVVLMAIRQTCGLKPSLVVSEGAFEMLMTPTILKMRPFALKSVEAVKRELQDMTSLCMSPTLDRFPVLKKEITRVVHSTVEKSSKKTIEMVNNVIDVEAGHFTYAYESVLKPQFRQLLVESEKLGNGTKLTIPFRTSTAKLGEDGAESQETSELLEMSPNDRMHVYVLGKMLNSYFHIVAGSVQNYTAKSVVTFLVNVLRDTINSELCVQLMKDDSIDAFFRESEETVVNRENQRKRREALEEALDVLNAMTI